MICSEMFSRLSKILLRIVLCENLFDLRETFNRNPIKNPPEKFGRILFMIFSEDCLRIIWHHSISHVWKE